MRSDLPGRLVGSPWFWIALIGLLFGAPFLRGLRAGKPPAPPPVLGAFPVFALDGDRGEHLSSASMRRHAFIANLLCVGCGAEGSLAAEAMRKLQHRSRNLGGTAESEKHSADPLEVNARVKTPNVRGVDELLSEVLLGAVSLVFALHATETLRAAVEVGQECWLQLGKHRAQRRQRWLSKATFAAWQLDRTEFDLGRQGERPGSIDRCTGSSVREAEQA